MRSAPCPRRSIHRNLLAAFACVLTLAAGGTSWANTAPTIQPIGDRVVYEGSLLTFTITATDPESPPQTLTFTPEFGFPYNATLTPDGVFSWTPEELQASCTPAPFGVIVRVTDDGLPPMSSTQLFFIEAREVNVVPTLTVPGPIAVVLGETVDFGVSTWDPDFQFVTLSLVPPSPADASIDWTGHVFWTPAESGSFVVRVEADDACGGVATADVPVTVVVNNPPIFTSVPGPIIVTAGELVSFQIAASDPDSHPVTLSLIPPSPADAGIVIDLVLWFTTEPGSFVVRVQADDGHGGIATADVPVTVVADPIVLIGQLAGDVQDLVAAGILSRSEGKGLTAKLDEAIKKLQQGQTSPAVNKLSDFISQVQAYVNSRRLPAADGDALVAAAQSIIEALTKPATALRTESLVWSNPATFALGQNAPNPFRGSTEIPFVLPSPAEYSMSIHDLAGRLVRTYQGWAGKGELSLAWDGRDDRGVAAAAGVYFYTLRAGGHSTTRRMLLLAN